MSDNKEADFDEAAWLSRLKKAHTQEHFMSLFSELPNEPPMTDDEVVEHFQTEMAAFEARQAAEGWPTDKDEAALRGWCRFWFMAEWFLPADQQKRCTERVLRLAGYA